MFVCLVIIITSSPRSIEKKAKIRVILPFGCQISEPASRPAKDDFASNGAARINQATSPECGYMIKQS